MRPDEEQSVQPESHSEATHAGTSPNADIVREESWHTFSSALADGLSRMATNEFLVLSLVDLRHDAPDVPNYYVQFAAGGDEGFLAEAVSNEFVSDPWKLSARSLDLMLRLGWSPANESTGSRENFFRDWRAPTPFTEVVDFAVSTLRQVYGVTSPEQLAYKYFERDGRDLELKELGIRRELSAKLRAVELTSDMTIVETSVRVDDSGALVVHEATRDGMFTSLNDVWKLTAEAKDQVLLRLIAAKFTSGSSFANWLTGHGISFVHVGDYVGYEIAPQ